jgi:hypothetical protein
MSVSIWRRAVIGSSPSPGLRPTSPQRGEVKHAARPAHLGDENHWSPAPRRGEGWGEVTRAMPFGFDRTHFCAAPSPSKYCRRNITSTACK